jgi:hypothetical protein
VKHGEFRTPHALMFDAKGRLWVADRGNHRIEIFDQDGKYLESRYMFGASAASSSRATRSTRSTPSQARSITRTGATACALARSTRIASRVTSRRSIARTASYQGTR